MSCTVTLVPNAPQRKECLPNIQSSKTKWQCDFSFWPMYTAYEWDQFETLEEKKSLFVTLFDRYETLVEITTSHNINQ